MGLLLLLLVPILFTVGVAAEVGLSALPSPTSWPLQFHALLFINSSAGNLQSTDLWYDWPNGRNFNIIHNQLKNIVHDLEWTNGTSFYYDLDALTCKTILFEVGILRPDWLVDNSTYLGQQTIDGFTCNVWSKADFIVYYEDVDSNRPVRWVFSSGMVAHVMTFEEGAVLEDSNWQAPAYCFDEQNSMASGEQRMGVDTESVPLGRLLTSLDVLVRNLPWSLKQEYLVHTYLVYQDDMFIAFAMKSAQLLHVQ
ncbi:hypothetical protein GOP47_0019440 [Adiantum capillus-veneris]|uniref:Uncharacterized protein n=1 Tax=Adiantum capillus-veneris TaxID=13818 RepID=A0A9D4UBB1_ADICA|nr:hypothetical protein GOP47_0019440 [Adiantum capillus-veneris]